MKLNSNKYYLASGVKLIFMFFLSVMLSRCYNYGRSVSPETSSLTATPEVRAVWASTLSPCMNSPEEIRELVASVRRANLNTIIAQVRHRGVVYYKSRLEPRAPAIRHQPDFDPLAVLLQEAHNTSGGKPRLDVYAWFNVFHIGKLKVTDNLTTPTPIQIAHPDWFTLDRKGNVLEFLEPGLPAVQDYLIALIEECLTQYDVDGINLDFIRYPEQDAGYHPVALLLFNRLQGRDGGNPSASDKEWNDFRRAQITAFVRRCAVSVWRLKPEAIFSVNGVGFGGPPVRDFSDSSPYCQVFQDWAGWLEQGYLDLVCRMGYKQESVPLQARHFRGWADFSRQLQDQCPGRYVTIGIGGYLNSMPEALSQYREALKRNLGTSLFSYHRPIKEASPTGMFGSASPFWEVLGREIYPVWVPPPRPLWRLQYGIIAGILKDSSGRILNGVKVRLKNTPFETTSDGSGFFVFTMLTPGSYTIDAPGAILSQTEVKAHAGKVVLLN